MAEVVENPVKMDDITVKKLEEAFALGGSVSVACLKANISRTTYYNWIKSFPEYEDRFNSLKESPVLKALMTINEDLNKPETAKWYLERRAKDFHPKQEIEIDEKKLNLE